MRFLEHFDHFVVPVDDVVAAEDFYEAVFGCRIAIGPSGTPMRIGLNVRQWKGGMLPHTFFDVVGRRIGVYLQTDERAKPASVWGAPTYSFIADEAGLDEVEAALAARQARYASPGADETPMAARSLLFTDPAGNHFHVYVPRGGAKPRSAGSGRLAGVGYIRLEAPDLERSVRFYGTAFGLEALDYRLNERLGAREAVLPLPGGQSVILAETQFAPKGTKLSRLEPGPHLAFYIAPERWEPFLRNLAALGISHGDRAADLKDRRGQERDTYVDDPAGYVLQLVSDAA
jgi:predicted enzyme related to lactoylglutathione lyase